MSKGYLLQNDDDSYTFPGRTLGAQGADVASANDLTLGADGNTFEITGNTQINAITTTNWQNGSVITLLFTSDPIVKHNTAGGAGTAPVIFADGLDLQAEPSDTMHLVLAEIGGTQAWREIEAEKGLGTAASVFQGTADKTIANTVTETTLVPTGVGTTTFPANFFTVGKTILILIKGHVSDTGNPTITVRCKLGGSEVCATSALTLGSVTNDYFESEIEIVCRSTGVSGTVVASGEFIYENSNSMDGAGMVKTSTTTVDTTGTLALDVTAQWGTASALNTITAQIFTVEELD